MPCLMKIFRQCIYLLTDSVCCDLEMSITTNVIESQFSDDDGSPKPRRGSAGYHYHYHSQDISFFQICQSCFWCASALHATRMIKIGPICTSEEIDSLPISPNEVYTYDVIESTGVILSFKSFNCKR